jgi:hypothetical protein
LLGKPDDENRTTLSYLLSWYKSTNTDAALLAALLQDKPEDEKRITCFPGTKVQILTLRYSLRSSRASLKTKNASLAFLVQKYKY